MKVGTIAPEHTQSIVLESIAYETARTLSSIKQSQTNNAMRYLSQASSAEEFEEFAQNLGITDFFTTLAVWDLFVTKLNVTNLTAGTGNGSTGFRFRAMTDSAGDGSNVPIYDIYYNDKKLFEAVVSGADAGDIIFGDINNGGLRWDYSSNTLRSKDDKLIINTDGSITVTDITANSGTWLGNIANGFLENLAGYPFSASKASVQATLRTAWLLVDSNVRGKCSGSVTWLGPPLL